MSATEPDHHPQVMPQIVAFPWPTPALSEQRYRPDCGMGIAAIDEAVGAFGGGEVADAETDDVP